MITVVPALFGVFTGFLVLFVEHRPLSAFYTNIHFPKPVEFPGQILVLVLFLLYYCLQALRYLSRVPSCCPSLRLQYLVVCVQSRGASGYIHPRGFSLSPSLTLVQPYVDTIIPNAADHTSHADSMGQFRRVCHVPSQF